MPSNATGKIPKGYEAGQIQQFTPEQMQLYQNMYKQIGSDSSLYKTAMGDESEFAPIEERMKREFQGGLGNLASRFSQVGARRSSGFQNTATQATSDFTRDLAERRQSLQRQALMDLHGLSHSLLSQRPYENFLVKKQPKLSAFSRAMGIGLPLAGAAAGGFFGGPAGAALGGQLGGSLASGFTGQGGGGGYEGISQLPTSWGGNSQSQSQSQWYPSNFEGEGLESIYTPGAMYG